MHLSPDVLALLALGETPDEPVDRAHLESCAQCRTELDELSRAVRVGRSVTEEDMLITPADRVWHGIRAELGLDESATSAEVVSLADRRVGNAAAPPRTVRRWLVPLLAAALALVVGVGLGIGLDRSSGQRETVIAETKLDPCRTGPARRARRPSSRTPPAGAGSSSTWKRRRRMVPARYGSSTTTSSG